MFKLLMRALFVVEGLLLCGSLVSAQSLVLNLPRPSPHAVVTQRIGITDVTIAYHRPMVNKRIGVGWPRALRTSLACRSQRKYHHRVH